LGAARKALKGGEKLFYGSQVCYGQANVAVPQTRHVGGVSDDDPSVQKAALEFRDEILALAGKVHQDEVGVGGKLAKAGEAFLKKAP
jgi:hypothetical protein